MAGEYMQPIKVVLVLCSCFFAYGTFWSNWAFDYHFLWSKTAIKPELVTRAAQYYTNQLEVPDIIKYIPFVNLVVASFGFAAGLATMEDGNLLFDGASLVLMIFAIATWSTTVKHGILIIGQTNDLSEITLALKNIAAANFIIVLAVTGIIGLQITHYFVTNKSENVAPTPVKAKPTENKKTK